MKLFLSTLFIVISIQFSIAQHSGLGSTVDEPKINHPVLDGCNDENLSENEKLLCTVEKMNFFFERYMAYPEKAMKAKLEGAVIVSYVVQKDGRVKEVKVMDDIGKGCGREAERLVKLMNSLDYKWVPSNPNEEFEETRVFAEVPFQLKE